MFFSPFIFQDSWADGWTIIAIPKDNKRITKYEDLKKEIRASLKYRRSFFAACRPPFAAIPFASGWCGFLSYDLGAKFLGIKQSTKKDLDCPEVYFAYCDKAYLKDPQGKWWYWDGVSLRAIEPAFRQAGSNPVMVSLSNHRMTKKGAQKIKSNLTHSQYIKKIAAVKEKLFAGETYQVNFSQRFLSNSAAKPYDLFKKITDVNPSPYQFYCENADFAVVSNSPELLVRGHREGDEFRLETKPIKGTVPRGKNAQEDAKNIKKLLACEKENAELTMIVDLERNDLGKVCRPGTVRVAQHRAIEKYSHVIHTVSTVRGILGKKRDVFDVIEAMFPGGSITGCPKKRAMEIIDRLEDFRRGVYCGSAGYISDTGDFEFNIMIRTLWLEKGKKGAIIYFHSGGGIVVDSNAESEFQETEHKAKALIASIVN